MQKVAILGLAGDPPHNGHKAVLQLASRYADEVWLMPCYKHKFYHCSREKVRLEAQPELVLAALSRLVDRLLDKNILNLDDLHYIADTGWSMKDLKLKPEEKDES